jgi:hypothetical protein
MPEIKSQKNSSDVFTKKYCCTYQTLGPGHYPTCYRRALFTALVNSEQQVPQFLKTATLKNMTYNIGVALRNIIFF